MGTWIMRSRERKYSGVLGGRGAKNFLAAEHDILCQAAALLGWHPPHVALLFTAQFSAPLFITFGY